MSELIKVKVKAYLDKELKKPSTQEKFDFVIPINPENYSRSMKVEYEKKKGQGNQKTNPKYTSTENEKIKLEFVLDGTGTVAGYDKTLKDKLVSEQIEKLLETVYRVKGKMHKPHFLKLTWGEHLVFDCILENLDINYTLFNANGEPLRAKVSASFCGYVEPKKRAIEQDNRSADLTHVRQVLAGDKLTLMVKDIYGDDIYYTQVARVNNLTSFRNLEVGDDLIFPPVQKTNS